MGGPVERVTFLENLEVVLDENDLSRNVCLPAS